MRHNGKYGSIFAPICFVLSLICATANVFATPAPAPVAARATADHTDQQQQQPKLKINFKLEWIGEPQAKRGPGEPKLITGCTNTGSNPSQISAGSNYAHHLGYSGDSDDLKPGEHIQVRDDELRALLVHNSTVDALAKQLGEGTNLTTNKDQRSMVTTKIWLDKRSRSVVNFRDNVIKLSGRVRRTINHEKHALDHKHEQQRKYKSCLKKSRSRLGPVTKVDCRLNETAYKLPEALQGDRVREYELVVQSTEVDSNGVAVGEFSVDYFGTEMYKHPAFYNLDEKSVHFEPKAKANKKLSKLDVRSPFACAEFAIEMNKQIALYDIIKMSCQLNDLPEVEAKSIADRRELISERANLAEYLFDRVGSPLGEYKLSKWSALANDEHGHTKLSLLVTKDQFVTKQWLAERECDLVSARESEYTCFRFPTKTATVLMFKRQVANMWV